MSVPALKWGLRLPRFYPILDGDLLQRHACSPLEAASALLDAGVRVLQFRHKGHYSRSHFEDAERIASLCSDAGALFVVNDRADIALLLNSALHVGQNDLTPADARAVIGGRRILGLSTHNQAQLKDAAQEPVDYLALGPIFDTGSKTDPDPVVGIEELRRLRPYSVKPLVAIGGIALDTASSVYAAGADSIAVIGDLFTEGASPAAIRRRAELWLAL